MQIEKGIKGNSDLPTGLRLRGERSRWRHSSKCHIKVWSV